MVHYYLLAEDLQKKRNTLDKSERDLEEKCKELKEILKEVRNLEEMLESKRNHRDELTKNIEQLNCIVKELEKIVKNSMVIDVIIVKDEIFGLPNGLVDLKRDILMKLIGIVRDDDKVRNMIGIGKFFFVWMKLRCFRFVQKKIHVQHSFTILPNTPPMSYAHTGRKISKIEGGIRWTFLIDCELSAGRIYTLDADVKGLVRLCLALKSLFPYLHQGNPFQENGTCCISTENYLTVQNDLYFEEWGINQSRDTPVTLELDASQPAHTGTHTLHFFLDGRQAAVAVTGIPDGVCYAFQMCEISSVEVKSLRSMKCTAVDGKVKCTEYKWQG